MTPQLERATPKHAAWLTLALLISGCGGSSSSDSSSASTGSGSSSSTVAGLALPSNVSVVTANNAD